MIKSSLEGQDKRLMSWVVEMHKQLNRDSINLKEVMGLVDGLSHLYKDAQEDQLEGIIYPETKKGRRIANIYPVPTTAFQVHYTVSGVPTNANGEIAWVFNPFFFQDAAAAAVYSTFFVNNNVALAGNAASNFFAPVDIGYGSLAGGVYGSFKLSGGSIIVSYTGRLDASSGVIGTGIGLNNQSSIGTPLVAGTTTYDAGSAIFGNFLYIDNLFFPTRTQAVNGSRQIYFPIDQKYLNFYPVFTTGGTLTNSYLNGFYFAGYGAGLPPSVSVLRWDFYMNYEAVPQPSFANFIPAETPSYVNGDYIQKTSERISSNPKLVSQPSSEIPGAPELDVANVDTFSKLQNSGLVSVDYLHAPGVPVMKNYLANN